jgi:hypothetical protein
VFYVKFMNHFYSYIISIKYLLLVRQIYYYINITILIYYYIIYGNHEKHDKKNKKKHGKLQKLQIHRKRNSLKVH